MEDAISIQKVFLGIHQTLLLLLLILLLLIYTIIKFFHQYNSTNYFEMSNSN